MADKIIRKRVTLHPLKTDGTIDETTNLYPKTFLDGIVDREGNPVEIATEVDVDKLLETLETKQDIIVGTLELNDYMAEEIIMDMAMFLSGWNRERTTYQWDFIDEQGQYHDIDLTELKDYDILDVHYVLHAESGSDLVATDQHILLPKLRLDTGDLPYFQYTSTATLVGILDITLCLTEHGFVGYQRFINTDAGDFADIDANTAATLKDVNSKQKKLKNAKDDTSIIMNDRGDYVSIKVNPDFVSGVTYEYLEQNYSTTQQTQQMIYQAITGAIKDTYGYDQEEE